jgi:hypothetical protein
VKHLESSILHSDGSPGRAALRLPTAGLGLIVVAALAMAGCPEDPPADTDLDTGRCPAGQVFNELLQVCVPAGDTGGDADAGADIPADTTPDETPDVIDEQTEDTSDAGDGDLGDFGDAGDLGDGGDADDTGEADAEVGGDDPDVTPDVIPDADADVVPDADADTEDGSEDPSVDPTTDAEVDVADASTGDEPDAGTFDADLADVVERVVCPDDRFELDDPNDFFNTASLLHPSRIFAAGEPGAVRAEDGRERRLCGRRAFVSALGDDTCVDGGECECEFFRDIGACGPSDPDWLRFYLLAGDRAWVRLQFTEDVDTLDVIVELMRPASVDFCGAPSTCSTAGFGNRCEGNQCQTVLTGNWVDTDESGGVDAYEWNTTAAIPLGETSIVVPHVVHVVSAVSELAYDIQVQIAPTARACFHDAWDDNWDEYEIGSSSETACEEASCTRTAGFSGDVPAPCTSGRLCGWDRQDFVRHVVSSTSNRRIRVTTTGFSPVTVQLQRQNGLDWIDVGDAFPGSAPTFEQEFPNLPAGTYQIEISGSPTGYDACFFTDLD